MKTVAEFGAHRKNFYLEDFAKIYGCTHQWRIDSYIRYLDKHKNKRKGRGRILPFVRGLRFSALLIYFIRSIIRKSGVKGLHVNWGHLLDEQGQHCSCECDIIIHKNKEERRWNGETKNKGIMDFRFINQEDVLLVISCKAFLTASNIDMEYCKLMKEYVKDVWLFAECCNPKNLVKINETVKRGGYSNFWYLYGWDEIASTDPNKNGWLDFVSKVEKIIENYKKTKINK